MNELIRKPIKDLVDYIKNSIDIIISIKLDEELGKYKYRYNNNDPNATIEFEKLLQKEEEAIREHISIEQQLKIQCEKYAEKLDILEDEKIILLSEIVSKIFFNF